jgi:hypothetical protein
MRGGFLHNMLVTRMESAFLRLGANVQREYPVTLCDRPRPGAVDLFVTRGRSRIVCEIELTLHRIRNDFAKALALQVDTLLIVAPTWRAARAMKRQCRMFGAVPQKVCVSILPLGAALQYVTNYFSFFSEMDIRGKQNLQIGGLRNAYPLA